MASMMDKYGVPLPSGRNRCMSQPKVKHKFRVIVYNFGIDVDEKDYIAMEVEEVDRPSLSFDVHQLNLFTGNTSYIGKHNWKEITLVLRDSVNNNATRAVARQLQKQLDYHRRITAKSEQSFSSYKFSMIIETTGGANPEDTLKQLGRNTALDVGEAITNNLGLVNSVDKLIGGTGYNSISTLEYWKLTGCIITDISYDTLDYSSSEYVTMKLTIKPDFCQQYDTIEEIYKDQISSLLPDGVDNALNVVDKIFGSASL